MNRERAAVRGRRPFWRTMAAVVTMGLLGMAPVTASAADETEGTEKVQQLFSQSQCSSAFFCLWSADTYTGTFTQTASSSPAGTNSSVAKSMWNRTGKAVRVYSGVGSTGTSVCFAPAAKAPSINITARTIDILSGTSC